GLLAGFYRGVVDQLVSRLIDVWMSFPPVLLSIVLAAVVGAGLPAVILAIVVIDWTRFARVVRSEVQVNLQLDYVAAARVVGLPPRRILLAEILPNVLPLLATLLTIEMGIAVIVEAILSFVGLSVSTDTPTWGGMIAEGRQVIYQAPLLVALPIACIVVTVLGFNLLGDGLRGSLDPLRRRGARGPSRCLPSAISTSRSPGSRCSAACRCRSVPARCTASSANPAPASR